jgi:TonB family protein
LKAKRTITGLLLLLTLAVGQAEPSRPDSPPRILTAAKPEYPAHLMEQRVIGSAMIFCQVDESGSVSDTTVEHASMPEFGAAALAAVQQYKFHPAIRNDREYAVKIRVPVDFNLSDSYLLKLDAERPKEALPPGPAVFKAMEVDTMPKLLKEIRPETPAALIETRQLGQAVIGFVVDEHGIPRDIHTLITTHPACASEAAAVIRCWKFSPGIKHGNPVRTAIELPMVFFPENPSANGARVLPGASITLDARITGLVPDPTGRKFTPPRVRKRHRPEFPEEMINRGLGGRVMADLIISPTGNVTHIKSHEKTNLFFSTLAERALSRWTFHPAKIDGVPVISHVRQEIDFRLLY